MCWEWTVDKSEDKWYYSGSRCSDAKDQILTTLNYVNDKREYSSAVLGLDGMCVCKLDALRSASVPDEKPQIIHECHE